MTTSTRTRASMDSGAPKPRWKQIAGSLPFFAIHGLVVVGLFIWPLTLKLALVAAGLYVVRMFGVTAGYHRYFSHRTFKTSRVMQFLLAFLAQSSAQKGALWWAERHRHHHKHSDQPQDIHSVRQSGFWHSHMGWLFADSGRADHSKIKDLSKYPELRFLDRYWLLPPTALALVCVATMGWPGLFFGFFLSTVVLWHGTFTINSLSHVFGYQDYDTGEDSKNNWLLALITLGEGWHNNHHYYQGSTRQGFKWWQVDITYYVLRAMAAVGLVWDIREPSKAVLEGTWRPSKRGQVSKPQVAAGDVLPVSIQEAA